MNIILQNLSWLIITLFGVAAFWLALSFGFGTLSNIGAAIYPLFLSGILVLISVGSLIFGGQGEFHGFAKRPFIAISTSVILFGATVELFGIVPSIILSMLIAYGGQTERGYLFVFFYATIFAFGAWGLFSFALGLPLPIIRMP